MCGLVGIVSRAGDPEDIGRCHRAAACLTHRGPEGEGLWHDEAGKVVLAHRRLRIIDTSEAAAQPMHYGDRYIILHNGELYNYKELRDELERAGHAFRSASDTEVITAAYAAWGRRCLDRFDGAFAFVIWDRQDRQLFAARDRFGGKPFFFRYENGRFLFASELKAFWTMGTPKEVNRRLLYNFLTIGYTSNPGDPGETFYEGIRKLPPASFLTYDPEKDELSIERYWQVYPEENDNITDAEAIEKFTQLLQASILRRLRSDMPVGTSLSGGLDSSALVAFCDRLTPEHYTHKAFTASFPGFEKDETPFASTVTTQYGLQHHLAHVPAETVAEMMDAVMRAQEEPVSTASPLAQYAVYARAKAEGVKVVLDGQGADEVLAGYQQYYKWYWQELYREGALRSSGELSAARALGITEPFGMKNKAAARFPHFALALQQKRKEKRAAATRGLHPDFAAENRRSLYYTLPPKPDLNGVLHFHTAVHGLEELLRLADRNSMAHGVEVRLPYLSHELVTFLFTLPSRFKIREGWTKWLLRKACEDLLPPPITWRADKVGFEPPQARWMQEPQVQSAITESKKRLVEQQVLHADVLRQKIQPHAAHAAEKSDWLYWSAAYLFSK